MPGRPLVEDEQDAVAALVRRLRAQTWLVGGRDDELIEAVHRHAAAVRALLEAVGCALTVEPDLVRVHVPVEPVALMSGGDAPQGVWFWLTVAVLEGLHPKVPLGQLVGAVRAAAAEAEIPVTQSLPELRALVAGLRMLCERGVLSELEGRVDELMDGAQDPPVLLQIHHARLLHLLPRNVPVDDEGQWACDPGQDPQGWLNSLVRPDDEAVRVCGMLADRAVVHVCDLDDAERQWFSTALAREGSGVAQALGLHLEHRLEGAALVMPEEICDARGLGSFRFPHRQQGGCGTVRHATLLLIDYLTGEGERGGADAPGEGWYGAAASSVVRRLGELAVRHTRWRGEYRQRPEQLAGQIRTLLEEADLLRVATSYEDWWWLSPAAARWTVIAHDTQPANSLNSAVSGTETP
ncbi:TIGR02678 family protein [Streptomyces sp. NBC_01571]|uniref:DUF2398 family protein n=1 Tax=Streptomyces sp. NBC_01571 TaxID=2975883 RepID=UPI002254B00B|nr:DUF2398 family protein [Streptomyces sp. NBC_01571]MCX4581188.1 TIGR02678 family protein [Streptomyces sp. NBC_01571]